MYRVSPEQRKALGSGSTKALKDHMKSSATDDKMQQWFREGLAGDYPYILAFLLSFTLYRLHDRDENVTLTLSLLAFVMSS